VEKQFENKLNEGTKVDLNVTHFLDLRFQWRETKDTLKVHMSQEAFADNLIQQANLSAISSTSNLTPFRSGNPVDSIEENTQHDPKLEHEMRSYVGSLLWFSIGTRPDLSTITNILAKHQIRPSKKHIAAAKYVIKYLKGTKELGLTFSSESQPNDRIDGFLNFPINTPSVGVLTDVNWGGARSISAKAQCTPVSIRFIQYKINFRLRTYSILTNPLAIKKANDNGKKLGGSRNICNG